ncbi:putative leucine-rich repeat-containing protein DDB_G0290503 isoform X1 [Hydra vulgaris]|uniref:putative leucine-rich repeat-containing protein DDB_G0290503 isoform X1 n=1 Tax=Hydra vulgaris TaxID=6087 RepID=UPI0032E9EDFA
MADNVTNKKSKITKTKTYNKNLKKYSWRRSHRHIDSYLLPSVALVIAIPSAKKINLSLSHSSIVLALGFISRVAQLFVGDLIHGVVFPPISPTCIVSDDSDSVNVSQSDSLYAKVSKKRKFKPNDTNCIENISTAAERKEVHGNAQDSLTSEKCSSTQNLKLKNEEQSKHTHKTSSEHFQVVSPQIISSQDKLSLVSHPSGDNKFVDINKTKENFNKSLPKDSMTIKEDLNECEDFIKLKTLNKNVSTREKSYSKDAQNDTIQNITALKQNDSIDSILINSDKKMSFQKDAFSFDTKDISNSGNYSLNVIHNTSPEDYTADGAVKITPKKNKYKNDFVSNNNHKDNEIKQFNSFDEDLLPIFNSLNTLIEKGSSYGYNSSEFMHSISRLNQYSEMLNETLKKVNCNLFTGCNCGALNNSQLIEFHENMNHFKKQNEILCSENEALRNIVLRLNQEVANLKKDKENVEDKNISNEYISGLLSSYDQQLKEKDDIIVSLKEIKDKMIPEDKWNALKEQAKIVLEEYEDSIKQIHLYKETICKLTNEHSLKMIELENQLTEQSKGKKYAEQELLELKDGYLLLKSQIEKFEKSQGSIILLNDHLKIVENLNKEHKNEMNQLISKTDDMSFKLAALTKERDTLAVQTSELYAENLCLLSQVKTIEKHTRAQKKQINQQMKEIESLKKMDLTTKETLSQVIKVAEYVKQERDNLTDQMNQKKSEEILASHQESVELKRLQHHLKISKLKAKKKLNQLNQRLQEQNEEFDKLRKTYENELNDLKDIVRQKQNHIERLNFNKSSYDERFNELWSTFHENDKV